MRGAGKYYDPQLDYQSKIQDLREERTEKMNSEEDVNIAGEEYSPEVHEYLMRNTESKGKNGNGSGTDVDQMGVLCRACWARGHGIRKNIRGCFLYCGAKLGCEWRIIHTSL
jgi:hypothetical protein